MTAQGWTRKRPKGDWRQAYSPSGQLSWLLMLRKSRKASSVALDMAAEKATTATREYIVLQQIAHNLLAYGKMVRRPVLSLSSHPRVDPPVADPPAHICEVAHLADDIENLFRFRRASEPVQQVAL